MSQKNKTTPKPSPKNTLFNYFAKNNKTPQTEEAQSEKKEEEKKTLTGKFLDFGFKQDQVNNDRNKRPSVQDSSDDEKILVSSKKRRVIESDDDLENTDVNALEPPTTAVKCSVPLPKSETKKTKNASKTLKAKEDDEDDEMLGLNQNEAVSDKEPILKAAQVTKLWAHETFDFLKPDRIRDKEKRRPNDPNYDPRTVSLPQNVCSFTSSLFVFTGFRSTRFYQESNSSYGSMVDIEVESL